MIHERLTDRIEQLQAAGRVIDGLIFGFIAFAELTREHQVLHNTVPLVIDADSDGSQGWYNGHRFRTSPQPGAWIIVLPAGDLETQFEA